MSSMHPVGCCEPSRSFGLWFVKMDAPHNPSYYLVNRTSIEHPYVSLQKDLDDQTSIYFATEGSAECAIIAYIEFWRKRGEVPGVIGGGATVEPTVESQVMEFI